MSAAQRVLLINPKMTGRRNARFPLAVLSLRTALEGRHHAAVLDGNVLQDSVAAAARMVGEGVDAVGVSVMGGPQLTSAIAISRAIRARAPQVPIIWGGGFPTVCPEATLNSPYVDFVVRGQGEETLAELLDARAARDEGAQAEIRGLSWRRGGQIVHNRERKFSSSGLIRPLLYEALGDPRQYLPKTYLGYRTAGYQAGLGCRFRCTFCGVATMFRGRMALPPAQRLEEDLRYLRERLGADAIQFYDHNFFDREADMAPLLEVLARVQMPWWCYARADALTSLSSRSWQLVRRSRLRMAYIGAESPSDSLLHDIRKGTRADQTLSAIEQCRAHGVIPELSFMLA
ncbi:MAG TPA: radical SAM protein, partial [Steroidobacteraceae bacterium]|nr:radical SAM protein [Steroidobacteraceae bacterium]